MIKAFGNISRRGWLSLVRWTALGTLGCVCVAVLINWIAFRELGQIVLTRALISSITLPIILAGPLFFYLNLKLRELAILNHKLKFQATTDDLTGCLNRRAFSETVEHQLADASKGNAATNGALLVIDADNFKVINDQFGHGIGDIALRTMAQSIKDSIREGDFVGRLGGEEFGVYLPDADSHVAIYVAERIRREVEIVSFQPDGRAWRLSVSIGAAVFENKNSFEELFRAADKCLYEAKNQGRNRIVLKEGPPFLYAVDNLISLGHRRNRPKDTKG